MARIPPYRRGFRKHRKKPERRQPCGQRLHLTSSKVALVSQVPNSAFPSGSSGANEVWGYVSPSGREYGIFGMRRGTGFVDITDAANPVIVGDIPGNVNTIWRDMATYNEHAYIVTDGSGVGMQVVDLTDIDNGNVSLVSVMTQFGFNTAHNVAVSAESGFAYAVGGNLSGGGIVVIDLSVPTGPQIVGTWNGASVHDIYVHTYQSGPNAGREIAFAFAGESGLIIVDVTDKTDMVEVGRLVYPTLAYCHQGWLSEDRRLLYLGDELDELQSPAIHGRTTTYVINVENINNPFVVRTFSNGLFAIDHNLMVRGDYVYEANYTTGLRIFHAGSVANIQEVGFFDTFPAHNSATFDGAWGVYTGLPSGVILVSDRQSGLFVLLADCNGNGQDDGEEMRSGTGNDCNLNGILDTCDIAEGTAEDCNANGVLDECEFGDFDGNDLVDSLDFAAYAACLTSPCLDAPCSPPMYLDACCGLADSDRDGDNDLLDFAAWQRSLSGS